MAVQGLHSDLSPAKTRHSSDGAQPRMPEGPVVPDRGRPI